MRKFDGSLGEQDEALWGIRKMAEHYGVTLRALRFYEDRGLLQSRRNGTARLYDSRARSRLEVILRGKHLGFMLSEIRDLLKVNGENGPAFELALDEAQILQQIEILQRQKDAIEQAIRELSETRSKMQRPCSMNERAQQMMAGG